ncbi:GH3 auxin-responsive promoter family protein [Accumulibacter sp.]|uniref:GH3 family domain-containing protein n=1 Tax=Accumulibacter sp. TaxID=2053492 RepID=UPI00258B2484|nr:GH3 auxin-responsive promoter family protein [Accumulibacter sp.]
MSRSGKLAAPLLRAYCAPRAWRFARALEDVATTQRRTLARILRAVVSTGYASSLGLRADETLDTFRTKAPIIDYAAIEPWIAAQRSGQIAALAAGRIRCYEPTSGSSGEIKRIPYNDALLGAFRSTFAIWTHDLLRHALRLRSGRTFLSVSPPLVGETGLQDDREYLGGVLQSLLGRFLVTPPRLRDPAAFRDALACALVAAHDLEIVSVWNPSYLLILLEHFEVHRERLLPTLPAERRALLSADRLSWQEVWPSLQLVSCWTAEAAAAPARQLARCLPQALLQGKGLLATEAPITVPLIEAGGALPLIDEVFLELEDDHGGLHLLAEAEDGAEYALLVTQAGGLLRYRLGDRLRVCGRHRDTPLLEFIGRADAVSDLVGEKLGEAFVARILAENARADAFCTVLPRLPEVGRPRYCLLTDDPNPELARRLEEGLSQAFRYREARLLAQLDAVEVRVRPDMRRCVHDALIASGRKAGDIKDRALIPSLEIARQVHLRSDRRLLI